MKKLTGAQREIINLHLMIEGSENFDFYPCEDGISVIMVNKLNDGETKITKRKPGQTDPNWRRNITLKMK